MVGFRIAKLHLSLCEVEVSGVKGGLSVVAGLDLNKDKRRLVADSSYEDEYGVEDEWIVSVSVNSWSFSVSKDMRVE
ncbi:hypothetical protein Tco_1046370 [Tanacetum coccineum]